MTLLRYARELVADLEQMAVAMDDFRRGAGGHLRLWANTSAFAGFLPPLLAAFTRAHPQVSIDLEDAISEDAVRAVASGAAELAVIGDNTAAEGLQTVPADVDDLMLLLPLGHELGRGDTVDIGEVLHHDLVGMGRATSLMRQVAVSADALGRPLRMRVQVRSFDAMCRMVAAGVGIAVLPRAGAAPHLASMGLQLRPLTGIRTERYLLLAMRDRARLSAPAADFVALVEARMREHVAR